jgi:hypothetical protein
MKQNKIIYWTATCVCCAIMLFSACLYFVKYEIIVDYFDKMHYPKYLVYPLAVAKLLGIVAIISRKSKVLKDFAFAGFFFDGILAATAHFMANDGGYLLSVLLIIGVIVAKIFEPKAFENQ